MCFGYRKAHLAKLGEKQLFHDTPSDELATFVAPWTRLIANIHQFDSEPTGDQTDLAARIVTWFQAAPVDKHFMMFQEDEDSIAFDSVVLSGQHALAHSAFWSID